MSDEQRWASVEEALLTKHHKLTMIGTAFATVGIQAIATDAFDIDCPRLPISALPALSDLKLSRHTFPTEFLQNPGGGQFHKRVQLCYKTQKMKALKCPSSS